MTHTESDAIYAEIGRITTQSTELELLLEDVVGSLINDYQQYTRIVTAELSFSGVIALLLSLYLKRHGKDDHFERLQSLTKRADSAQQERNKVVHSIWLSAGTPNKVTRIKSSSKVKQGYRTQFENWDLEQFKELAREFHNLTQELSDLLRELISCGKAFNNPVSPTEK